MRRLAQVLADLPSDAPFRWLAGEFANRVLPALDLDGAAILHRAGNAMNVVASSGALQWRFSMARPDSLMHGLEISKHISSGPWLEPSTTRADHRATLEVAYIPVLLGATADTRGCLAFARQPGTPHGPLAERLPDLIAAAEVIGGVLRSAAARDSKLRRAPGFRHT